jgi:hypothetical protein
MLCIIEKEVGSALIEHGDRVNKGKARDAFPRRQDFKRNLLGCQR